MVDAVRKRWNLSVCLMLLVLAALAVSAQSEAVLQSDFENGTQNWEARGDRVSIKNDKTQSLSGAKSLKISGRTANWNGAQINLTKTLSAANTYKFTLSVKLAKGEADDRIKMTMQRGDSAFTDVGITSATANEWTTFSGKFKPSGGDPYLLLYVEALRPNTAYSIDDFKIELAGDDTPAQSGILLHNDFEDMTAQNWFTNGDGVEMFSSNASGSQSLKITGRTAPWNALALDISPLIFKGRTYLISVSTKLVKGQPGDSLKLTMKQTPPKGDPTYVEVSKLTPVTDGDWVTLSGEYKATTTDNNLLIYVESAGATTSFYIDNFMLKMP
jgi:opacity protein-like surface antigen